jgi:DnaK suppressor protein
MKSIDISCIPAGDYMNDNQLAYFRGLLAGRAEGTRAAVELHRQALAELAVPSDESDSGSVEEERRRLLAEVERQSQHLLEVASAIRRIDEGDYGYCEASGEEITLERLQAMPWAAYSIYSQEVLEHRLATGRRF